MGTAPSTKIRPPGRRALFLGVMAGVLAFVAVAATIASWLAGREAAIARQLLADGHLDRASERVDRWLESSPGAAEAHDLRARIAWARHDLGVVQQELEQARALGYPEDRLGDLWGLFLARINQPDRAEPHLRTAFESARPPDPEVAEALARIYLGSFRLGEAGAVLDRWARERPADARPHLLRTEVDRRISRDSEAVIRDYREALDRDPGLDRARLGLADTLRGYHRNAEAADPYARYIARRPDDPMGHLGAGQNALELGDEAGAVRSLDRALELAPRNPVILAARAAVEVGAHRFEAALAYSDRAVKADPFDQANRYQRMLILTKLGKRAEAEAERLAIDRIRKEQAEFDRISNALVQAPLDADLRSQAARWLMAHGHEQEAIDWANLVLAAQPAHPAMNRLLADYYRKDGQLGLANRHEALASPPSDGTGRTP